jgi:hypothetical protein
VFVGSVQIVANDPTNGGLTILNGTAYKPNGGMWAALSDARIKKDVRPFDLGVEQLGQVRPVRFEYNGLGGTLNDGREYVGVIAQELEKVAPFMVSSRKAKLHDRDPAETDIKNVDGTAFTYMLINAVKAQQQIIVEQEARIVTLERSGRPLRSSIVSPGAGAGVAIDLSCLAFALILRKRRKHHGMKGGAL